MGTVRIESEGHGSATKVTEVDTGAELSAFSADIHVEAGEVNRATIVVPFPRLDIKVDADIKSVCPVCGREEEPGNG